MSEYLYVAEIYNSRNSTQSYIVLYHQFIIFRTLLSQKQYIISKLLGY